MSHELGGNQAPRITQLYLNNVNDPAAGQLLSSPSGSIVQPYGGQVGGKLTLSAKEAKQLSDPNTGTLYGGVYQYVQFLATSTASTNRGQMMFWFDRDNFIVTPDVNVATASKMAGIAINIVGKGNYGFIQVGGKAGVRMRLALTKAALDGDLVVLDGTPGPFGDVLADATALTSPLAKTIIGVADTPPTNNTISPVFLNFIGGWGY